MVQILQTDMNLRSIFWFYEQKKLLTKNYQTDNNNVLLCNYRLRNQIVQRFFIQDEILLIFND